jgi:hypothetical protein
MIPVRNQCQFSWYCDGKSDEPKDLVTFQKIYDLMYDPLFMVVLLYTISLMVQHTIMQIM